MPSTGFHREKHLLTLGIVRVLDDRYADLLRHNQVVQLIVTNLRNRPLSRSTINSMSKSIASLYHSLVTGSKDFPSVPLEGFLRPRLMATPFAKAGQRQGENATPSPLTEAPAGMMVPAAGSCSSHILFPPLPEKAELAALRADRRNCVRTVESDSSSVTRVISTVFRTDSTELTNRWRVTDYSSDGHTLMSVLCQFTEKSAQCAMTQSKRKREETTSTSNTSTTTTTSSSSFSPPKKRLRV
ncbi:uncharacterized protein LOC108891411 [Lates calcarifer]|uniref:Uncharacterized protein LOC108874262 n=1 Tax=Lates calcarifer TaxID=8187 RepID=A0AAJ7LCL7_LATCA|nr:uncharacterized protein LOC108874262 [Lates calcarifer]XP_018544054.1 uncharacterized protein LOC108891411 [Lates calcarifer]